MKYQTAAKNTAIIAVIAALLISAKFTLQYLPNIEVVTPLIIVFTCVFRFKRVVFSVLVFCLLDNFIYSFSYLVTIQYFFHWPLLCLLTEITYKIFRQKTAAYALLALIMGILFWVETPAIYALLRFSPFMPSLIAGIPFMLAMVASGTVVTLLTFKPLYELLIKVNYRL